MDKLPTSLALVTGSAHKLGKAFALSLAHMGYSIALHYRGAATEAEQTAKEVRALGVDCLPIRADLTVPKKVDFLFSLVIDSHTAKSSRQLSSDHAGSGIPATLNCTIGTLLSTSICVPRFLLPSKPPKTDDRRWDHRQHHR